ncbi:MAG: hypothetical protein IT545_10385 [Rhodobacteraceae bacterium]|nr:hypothetical protein [Paracoccaceae bacterium]
MSDPLTRAEIEDVLSSIRRLVSEEGREARPKGAAGERLVLTPAQRIPAPPDAVAALRAAARRLAPPAGAPEAGPPAGAAGRPAEAEGARAPTLEQAIAELEAAVAAAQGEWEPDGSEPAAFPAAPAPPAAPALPAVTAPAAGEHPAPAADNIHRLAAPPPRAAAPAPADPPPSPGEFDADALRDLVAEIVREELQGALGERITRNVRKLVRAEIARALAGRQFD